MCVDPVRRTSTEWEHVLEAKAQAEAEALLRGATRVDEQALLGEATPRPEPLARRGSREWARIVAQQEEKAAVAEIAEAARASRVEGTLMVEFRKVAAGSLRKVSDRAWAGVAAATGCTVERALATGPRGGRALLLSGGVLVVHSRRVVLTAPAALAALPRLLDLSTGAARVAALVYTQPAAAPGFAAQLRGVFPEGEAAELGPVAVFVVNRLPSAGVSDYVHMEMALPHRRPDPGALLPPGAARGEHGPYELAASPRGFCASVCARKGGGFTLATDAPLAEEDLRDTVAGEACTVFLFALSPLLAIDCPGSGERYVAETANFSASVTVLGAVRDEPDLPVPTEPAAAPVAASVDLRSAYPGQVVSA